MNHSIKHIGELIKKDKIFLPADVYAQALDTLVITCVDIIIISEYKVLLIKRNIEPRKGHWWYIGGRMIAGENPVETAKRKLFTDLGISINDGILRYFNTYSTSFAVREQYPIYNGSHTVNITYVLEVNSNIERDFRINSGEISTYQFVKLDEIFYFLVNENEDGYIKTVMADLKQYL